MRWLKLLMGAWAISLMLAVAIPAFAILAWRKLAIVVRLAPEPRTDRPWRRAGSVLVNGFLQRRMIAREWIPGLMHLVIFAGFLTLLLRKIQLLAIGFDEGFSFPGFAGGAFAAAKDAVEIALLAALAYAFWRRYVLRPQRLEPNREALVVLSLITVIVVTDLLFDGFRFALHAQADAGIAHERDHAFAGRQVEAALAGWSAQALAAGYQLAYWTQIAVVLAFLVLLPTGEHFHIVTALPTLYFRRGGPANAVPAVDLERIMAEEGDGADLRVGVRTAADLAWKDGLDAFTCTECGRCKDACPTFLTGKPLSQKWVHDSLKQHLLAQREAIVAPDTKGGEPLPALVPGVIGEDTLWACTTCGYCEAACPIELEHLPKFYRLRQQRVLMEGAFPAELKPIFSAYEVQSNPWGFPASTRGDWAAGLGLPVVGTAEEVARLDYLYYVGSAESFDPRGQRIARAFVAILEEAGVRVGILGAAETSTGECVRRVGNEMLFQSLATQLVETLNGLRVTRIVTCDPHAYNTLKNEYPAFGGHYEVLHHTELIARLIAQGRIRVRPDHERVIYHEPCYLGRHNGVYQAPREILRALCSDRPLEFELNREKAMCCGAGGGRMWLEESLGTRINVLRIEQALPQAPRTIATACPYCAVMMADGVSAKGFVDTIDTRDIAELVAGAMVRSSDPPAAG